MKLSRDLKLLLVGSVLVARTSCQTSPEDSSSTQLLQAEDPPVVGIGFELFNCFNCTSAHTSSTMSGMAEEIAETLERDELVTVMGVQLSSLLCDSLPEAQDAPMLAFGIGPGEHITASQVSYERFDGELFEDGIPRMTWLGEAVDPLPADNEAEARRVSMTWTDDCDPETFMLKITSVHMDGTTSVIRTIPCEAGSAMDICVAQVYFEFSHAVDPKNALRTIESTSASSSLSLSTDPRRSGDECTSQIPKWKPVIIDMAIFYSDAAMSLLGVNEEQMRTHIAGAFPDFNQATHNSGVNLDFRMVHLGKLPYSEVSATQPLPSLSTFWSDPTVRFLRDLFQADILLLFTDLADRECGLGYQFDGTDAPAYSVVDINCIDYSSHIHEVGHNLGCEHNRQDTDNNTPYSHGWRYCDSSDSPRYRTLMSYRCPADGSVPLVKYFSNPDVEHLGKPTGTPTENNARTIRDNMEVVSHFRKSLVEETPPWFCPVGCYRDHLRNRVLTGHSVIGNSQMTPELCAGICIGSTYFGTEYGNECYCSLPTDNLSNLLAATCDYDCAGDASQTCGGFHAISVFQYHTEGIDSVSPTHLGCYADDRNYRIMERGPHGTPDMDTHVCMDLCRGYAFFGTQFGKECWCGDASTDYRRHGKSSDCTYSCAGNAMDICGGFDAMSVYEY